MALLVIVTVVGTATAVVPEPMGTLVVLPSSKPGVVPYWNQALALVVPPFGLTLALKVSVPLPPLLEPGSVVTLGGGGSVVKTMSAPELVPPRGWSTSWGC